MSDTTPNPDLIRVFEIPEISRDVGFLFAGGIPHQFTLVDWFQDPEGMANTETGRADMTAFIRRKKYFNADKSYLVLGAGNTFTIGYNP